MISSILPPLPLLRILPHLAHKACLIRLHSLLRLFRNGGRISNRRRIGDLPPRYHSSFDNHVSIQMSCRFENARRVFEEWCRLRYFEM